MNSQKKPILNKIRTSKNLPTLPHILLRLINACNDDSTTVKEISRIIDKDSSLSAKVMRMINSVGYGLPTRVTNMEQALLLLGTDAIKNIAVSAAVFQVFGGAKADGIFDLKGFWRHSLLCAGMAKLIARRIDYSAPEEAFLSGLLHDIGKLVLWVNFPKEYAEVLQSNQGLSGVSGLEKDRFGVTHSDVGAWMIGQWHLQSFMADALRYHHEPAPRISDALPLVKVVFLANRLTTDAKAEDTTGFDAANGLFGFSRTEVEQLLSENEAQVGETAQSLGMDVRPQESADRKGAPQDQEKEIDLLKSVRNVSLLQGTLQNLLEAYGQESILYIARQGLQVLFDIEDVLFLIRDPETNLLCGKEASESITDGRIRELALSAETSNCLPVRCLEEKRPLDSSGRLKSVELSIIDDQLIRLIGKDEILCLPLVAHGEPLGVMVLGMKDAEALKQSGQMNLLTMYANQTSLAVFADSARSRQADLVQKERLAAASALARKVAHEVNNPLGIIKNYVKIFGMKLPENDPVHDQLRIISEELDRVALIVQKLSDFSEPEVRPKEPVDVNALLSDLVKIVRESVQVESKVNIHLELFPSLPMIFSEKNSLKQVFINLIKNAVESMSSGGDLFIETRPCGETFQNQSLEDPTSCDAIQVTFRDNGPGISDDVKARLFEPFVTSKKGGHAGLGLSVVYNIVKELNGTITCRSEPPSGTRFDIVLPLKSN